MTIFTGKVKDVVLTVEGIKFNLKERSGEVISLIHRDCFNLDILQISSKSEFIVNCYTNGSECLDFHV